MHHDLRDGYLRRSRTAEIILLFASVAFCATTFSGDALYQWLQLSPTGAKLGLGVAAVGAFAASTVLLVIDWKGRAARHEDAAGRWASVVAKFREEQSDSGCWPAESRERLHQSYWRAGEESVDIPDRRFNRLKARYLMKVEVSKRIQSWPGAPRWVLWLLVRMFDTANAVRSEMDRNRDGGRDDDDTKGPTDRGVP